ncbi:helix-turn-helix transcriptional regulator [Mameliella sp. AT18]|uniref:helix-turn-helix domain-containing protein n=1 Tax=Mameliella sp. AT18 TaxID=3028385 RepID=UPI00237A58FA|nr:helix-turn-helix transcriptional regulator [Mameliella sp. AT18]MDD9732802.1 helix-turn-helix transcriptional regulator [Mameliella sp. AT18]
MITARQSRAARALLGWTQETLADKARISLTALKRLESESDLEVYESTRDQVRRALEGNGIVLLNSERGEGVMIVHDTHAGNSPRRS